MELITNKIFNLFANCKLVKGYSRSIICDLQRNAIYPIPNSLYLILEYSGSKSIDDIYKLYGEENSETIKEYFEFLTNKELIFFNNYPENFPKLNDKWDEPFHITNCIIDFNEVKIDNLKNIKKSLGKLAIKAIQIRVFKKTTLKELTYVLDFLKPEGLNSIELLIKYNDKISNRDLKNLTNKYKWIFTVTVFDAPESSYSLGENSLFGQIYYVKDLIISEKNCGIITPEFFTINLKTYTESFQHNSCLNRKISIDTQGNIKNCPSMVESFGNVNDTILEEAIEKPGFKKYWNLHKDKIHVCKDCEFRYICTDCRAYIEDPDDIFSKPLKCGYNPYIGKWEEWSDGESKKQVIGYYNLINI